MKGESALHEQVASAPSQQHRDLEHAVFDDAYANESGKEDVEGTTVAAQRGARNW